MRMRTIVLVATLFLVPLAGAHHSENMEYCNTNVVPLPPEPGLAQAYFVRDTDPFLGPNDFVFSWWIYQETNAVEGLQRHDDACSTPGFDDADGLTADTIIF